MLLLKIKWELARAMWKCEDCSSRSLGSYLIMLTFHQLVQAGNLLEPINGVDCSHSLGQIHIIRQSSGQISQQGIKRSEPVWGDGIHNPFKVPISISIETNFLGLLLRAERLQRAGSVKAAVGAMCGTGKPVHPWPSAVSLRLIPLIKVLQLHVSAKGHDAVQVESMRHSNKNRDTYLCYLRSWFERLNLRAAGGNSARNDDIFHMNYQIGRERRRQRKRRGRPSVNSLLINFSFIRNSSSVLTT